MAELPYYPDVKGAPQNSIIGGASLWVMGGKKPEEYKGVAKFFTFLSRPETQAWWHQNTGYLPITKASYELSRKEGYYDKNPGTDTSIKQMTLNEPTENSKGLRLGSFVQIRDIIEEELEQAFAGKKTAKGRAQRCREPRKPAPAAVREREQVSGGLRHRKAMTKASRGRSAFGTHEL